MSTLTKVQMALLEKLNCGIRTPRPGFGVVTARSLVARGLAKACTRELPGQWDNRTPFSITDAGRVILAAAP